MGRLQKEKALLMYKIVANVGQKCGSVHQKAVQLLAANASGLDEDIPFSSTNAMELKDEIEYCHRLWRDLSEDDPRAKPSSAFNHQQAS
jgi:hypothetical protein